MRTVWTKWGAMAAATFVAAAAAFAQLPEEQRIDLSLQDADMVVAIQTLTKLTGLQFVLEPGDTPYGKITLVLKGQTLDEALKGICRSAGATFHREEGGYYVIGHAKPAVAVDPVVPGNNANGVKPKSNKPHFVQKFKLRSADAKDVIIRLAGDQPEDGTNIFNRLMRFQRSSNPTVSLYYSQNPADAMYSESGNFRPQRGQAIQTPLAEGNNDIRLPGEASGQQGMGGGRAGGGSFGGGGGGFGQGGGFGGNQGGFGGNQGGFGGGFGQGGGGVNLQGGQGLVPNGVEFISYDPTDNSIVVRGNEEDIANLQRYITMFDVAPKQVSIKVEFITTSSSDSRALGFDWLYERGNVFTGNRPGTFARAGDPIFLNWATGNIQTRMRALLQTGRGRVVQAPIVRTLNNQPATVVSQIQTWIFLTQVVATQGGTVITVPQPVQIPINTGLSVAPRINDDGTITMFLQPQVTDLGQIRRGPNGEEIPDILTQLISVVARVKNGETIALGGLTRKSDTGSESKIPILGDLPIVGQFFRSRNSEKSTQELIIFVTPTVIEDETTGGVGG